MNLYYIGQEREIVNGLPEIEGRKLFKFKKT